MQANCSCHTLSPSATRQSSALPSRAAPFTPRLTAGLGSSQARRGVSIAFALSDCSSLGVQRLTAIWYYQVALTHQRVTTRPAVNVPAYTVCKAASAAKAAPPSAVAHLRFSRGSPSKVTTAESQTAFDSNLRQRSTLPRWFSAGRLPMSATLGVCMSFKLFMLQSAC